jgi:hypothetical protein
VCDSTPPASEGLLADDMQTALEQFSTIAEKLKG